MKRIITILTISAFTVAVYGQVSTGLMPARAPLTTLDQASIRCYYQFVQKDKAGLLQIDTMTLDIGAKMSEYYNIIGKKQGASLGTGTTHISRDNIRNISIRTNLDTFDDLNLGATPFTNNGRKKESAQLLKNRQTGEITIIDALGLEKYKFTETIQPQAWQITADTATILGYLCQKATATFRGRSYEAWFSPELPVNDGPWKFFGLPGLILKVTDTENIFLFVCVGIENLNPPQDITIEQIRFINSTRDDMAKIKLKQHGETGFFMNGGELVLVALKAKDDYNLLELE